MATRPEYTLHAFWECGDEFVYCTRSTLDFEYVQHWIGALHLSTFNLI